MELSNFINVSEDTLGGSPVFKGTRVPIESLFEHLQNGTKLEDFLEDFPSVSKEQAVKVLDLAKMLVLSISMIERYNENFNRRKSA